MNLAHKDNYIELGLNIAYYRKRSSLTQKELARKIGANMSFISKIETATVGVSLDKLFAISEALGIPPSLLLKFRED